jgi:hypothetical protein
MTVRTGGTCTIEDCPKPMFGRTWCSKHYATWQKYGDPRHETRRYVAQAETCADEGCSEPSHGLGLCKMHYRRSRNHGETTEPRERRFWAHVDKNGPIPEHRPELGPCWVWTGYVDKRTGYGQFGGKEGTRLPHRIAYEYLIGPIPKGLHVDHLCSNRVCVNAESHLEPVTPRQNIERGEQGAFWGYVPEVVPRMPKAEKPTVCTEDGCDRPVAKRTLCRPCYRKWLKDPDAVRPEPPTTEQRFWSKVDKPELGPCWVWTAGINKRTGYGRFGVRHGEMVDVHRHSYLLAYGSIPEKYDVHHACHLRHCLRPDHLIATTRSQNRAERKVRRNPAS